MVEDIESTAESSLTAYSIEIQKTKIYFNEPEIFKAFNNNTAYKIYCTENNMLLSERLT